ncbi:hypothetical protein TorRG33x02_062950, partial [Trema orientale]
TPRFHPRHCRGALRCRPPRRLLPPQRFGLDSDRSSGAAYIFSSFYKLFTDTSISSHTLLPSLRESLPDNSHIYDFKDIYMPINNLLAKRYNSSSSTSSWWCKLRGKDAMVFQCKFRRKKTRQDKTIEEEAEE